MKTWNELPKRLIAPLWKVLKFGLKLLYFLCL